MQEGLPTEHRRELLPNPLEELLNGGSVTDEGGGHLKPARRYIAHRRLHIVGDPFHEVGGVLVLDVEKLFVHLIEEKLIRLEKISRLFILGLEPRIQELDAACTLISVPVQERGGGARFFFAVCPSIPHSWALSLSKLAASSSSR